jgi:hypothetical protein
MSAEVEISTETEKYSHDKVRAEIAKLMAETVKISEESRKITREYVWYPFVTTSAIITAVVLASVAFTKLFLSN